MIRIEPRIDIASETFHYTFAHESVTDTTAPTGVHMLAEFSVSWGSRSVFDAPDSQILEARLLTNNPRSLYNTSLIGSNVYLVIYDADTGKQLIYLFNGIITSQTFKPRSPSEAAKESGYYYCTITATSVRALLENTPCEAEELPNDQENRKRIEQLVGYFQDKYSLFVSDVIGGVRFDGGTMPKVEDARGKSIASMLDDIYQSAGSLWEFWPNTGQIEAIPIEIREPPKSINLKPDIGSSKSLMVNVINEYSNVTADNGSVPGKYCVSNLELKHDLADEITRVRVKYHGDGKDRMVERRSNAEIADYATADMEIDSVGWWDSWAETAAEGYRDMADLIRSRWTPTDITYKTELSGGKFPARSVTALFNAVRDNQRILITNQYKTAFDTKPHLVNFIGGTTRYHREHRKQYGDWEITLQPVPIVEDIGYFEPVTWEQVPRNDPGPFWHVDGNEIHESVSWLDLKHVEE